MDKQSWIPMSKGKHYASRKLSRRAAFQAIFNAFRWLTENGSTIHTPEWLGGYPLLKASSPRAAFLAFEILCHPQKEVEQETIAIGPTDYTALFNTNVPGQGCPKLGRFVVMTYLDAPRPSENNVGGGLLEQNKQVKELFREKYRSEDVLIVRSDSLRSNGNNSVRENITNLICAEYFMLDGYIVLSDCESGPDLIALKTNLVDELSERKFIGRGASVSQLATIRAFGKVADSPEEHDSGEELVAIESESVNPNKGVNQLMNGYQSQRFSYMGFFDRRVLAAPFFSYRKKGLDVLTYDTNGIEYWRCDEPRCHSDFWKNRKLQFMEEIEKLMKTMLLLNLTPREIAGMVSSRPSTAFSTSRESAKLEIDRILDTIEGTM